MDRVRKSIFESLEHDDAVYNGLFLLKLLITRDVERNYILKCKKLQNLIWAEMNRRKVYADNMDFKNVIIINIDDTVEEERALEVMSIIQDKVETLKIYDSLLTQTFTSWLGGSNIESLYIKTDSRYDQQLLRI